MENKSVEEVVEEIDLVGVYAEKAMFLKSKKIDETNYPFIKKLTDEEYTTFRDVIRKTLQTSQEREREIVAEIESSLKKSSGSKSEIDGIFFNAYSKLTNPNKD